MKPEDVALKIAALLPGVAGIHGQGLNRQTRQLRVVEHLREGLADLPASHRGHAAAVLADLAEDLLKASSEMQAILLSAPPRLDEQ